MKPTHRQTPEVQLQPNDTPPHWTPMLPLPCPDQEVDTLPCQQSMKPARTCRPASALVTAPALALWLTFGAPALAQAPPSAGQL
ncbi:MAG: hypothetical protein Q8R98_13155, partial [Rubrivivax sp.]|nr:hypothetical protein [Rubrivivax sp.]